MMMQAHHHHHRVGGGVGVTLSEESAAPPSQLPPLTLAQVNYESPSVRAGMTMEQERRCRAQACALLKLVAEILRLPMAPTVTALTFVLRFYARHSYAVHSPQFVVPTCLYVASKLEVGDHTSDAHTTLWGTDAWGTLMGTRGGMENGGRAGGREMQWRSWWTDRSAGRLLNKTPLDDSPPSHPPNISRLHLPPPNLCRAPFTHNTIAALRDPRPLSFYVVSW